MGFMHKKRFSMFVITLMFILVFGMYSSSQISYGAYSKAPLSPNMPTINDDKLAVEKIADGLDFPTSMAFVGPNDILVTEKNTGEVMRVLNGQLQAQPVLDVAVANAIERGLLGIAVSPQPDGKTYVFLYFTESGNGVDGSDEDGGVEPSGNRLYRYEYVDGKLINPLLLLDLTATPVNERAEHNGGKVLIGPDKNVYVVVGNVGGHLTQAQNIEDGPPPNGLSGVLRITQDGQPVPSNPIFGDDLPLNLYYAMGFRNSFGMDFDPLTGNLWDTENGPTRGDEINLVGPGFNSGFALIQGYAGDDLLGTGASADDLVLLGDGYYSDPKFAWTYTIGVTALKFLNSDKLGSEYANNMFVGDINNGLLYRFILTGERDGISIKNDTYVGNTAALADNKVDDTPENRVITFGQGFGGITDIQVGPSDGYPYVLSHTGSLFKILPSASKSTAPETENQPSVAAAASSNVAQNDTQRAGSIPAAIIGIKGAASYAPNPIEISAGQTITWVNGDAVSHTVTSGTDGDSEEGLIFDSDAIIPDQSYSLTFDEPGKFEYFCIYHPTMVGMVNVVSSNGEDTVEEEEEPVEEEPVEDTEEEDTEEEDTEEEDTEEEDTEEEDT